jgi:hypothetical protein
MNAFLRALPDIPVFPGSFLQQFMAAVSAFCFKMHTQKKRRSQF